MRIKNHKTISIKILPFTYFLGFPTYPHVVHINSFFSIFFWVKHLARMVFWSRDRDLNSRPPAYHADDLPLSYRGVIYETFFIIHPIVTKLIRRRNESFVKRFFWEIIDYAILKS